MKKETILIFSAHSDDEIIGMGGTISKYSEEGHRIISVIFTSGENSSPWLKQDIIKEERENEAIKIDKFLGCEETIFLGISDQDLFGGIKHKGLKEYIDDKELIRKVTNIIKKYWPDKIFTHSKLDPHADHKAANEIVFKALSNISNKDMSVFVFEVWNILNETRPRMYVDVSKTFKKKIQAMKMFKSQKFYVYMLFMQVYLRAIFSGFHTKCRYAERFYKIR